MQLLTESLRRWRQKFAVFVKKMTFAGVVLLALVPLAFADRLHMADGTTFEVDEAWEDAQGVWFRRGNVTQRIERASVRRIERGSRAGEVQVARGGQGAAAGNASGITIPPKAPKPQIVWVHLVGGARVEVDEATETPGGVWYRRGVLSLFIDCARVARVEREQPGAGESPTLARIRSKRGWSTGSARFDALIKENGARYGVDPFLIFCVMEQESQFNARALSPKGARGLMQLMPGTAARFGVRSAFDPAENIKGGTRYLRELLTVFGGRVELVLASYNAGEGAVMRYGQRVPPYRETRNYVQRISKRYGQTRQQDDSPAQR
ncbi:MAG: lytic transglycosylase domain-containing protein [Acidobacteriota bacterium]|nr:lytic transglycosylase domain-containing protein [Acidobacteriota bacterium]